MFHNPSFVSAVTDTISTIYNSVGTLVLNGNGIRTTAGLKQLGSSCLQLRNLSLESNLLKNIGDIGASLSAANFCCMNGSVDIFSRDSVHSTRTNAVA